VNTRAPRWCCSRGLPWCAEWEAELKKLFGAYVEAKQQQNVLDYDDLLLFWADMAAEPALAAQIGARFDHVLIDEYQDTNRLQAAILLALKPDGRGRDGGGRRRAVDLLVPRRHGAQHPRLSRAVHAAGPRGHAGAQLPLDAADPRRVEPRDRAGRRAARQDLWTDKPSAASAAGAGGRRGGQARWVADKVLRTARAGWR
jgi:DNA helicase-2/ATP-dependent DNA helicase PcrA